MGAWLKTLAPSTPGRALALLAVPTPNHPRSTLLGFRVPFAFRAALAESISARQGGLRKRLCREDVEKKQKKNCHGKELVYTSCFDALAKSSATLMLIHVPSTQRLRSEAFVVITFSVFLILGECAITGLRF